MWKVRTGLVSLIHYCRAMDGMTTLHAWSYSNNMLNINYEPTLKSKACLKCLYFTKIISDLCRYLEYFSYLYAINQTE